MNEIEKKTIFIVDDNDTDLKTAQEALSGEYRVMLLTSTVQLFAGLKRFTPDLIFLNTEMRGTDGLEVIKQLKANCYYSHIPIILLTDMSDIKKHIPCNLSENLPCGS